MTYKSMVHTNIILALLMLTCHTSNAMQQNNQYQLISQIITTSSYKKALSKVRSNQCDVACNNRLIVSLIKALSTRYIKTPKNVAIDLRKLGIITQANEALICQRLTQNLPVIVSEMENKLPGRYPDNIKERRKILSVIHQVKRPKTIRATTTRRKLVF